MKAISFHSAFVVPEKQQHFASVRLDDEEPAAKNRSDEHRPDEPDHLGCEPRVGFPTSDRIDQEIGRKHIKRENDEQHEPSVGGSNLFFVSHCFPLTSI